MDLTLWKRVARFLLGEDPYGRVKESTNDGAISRILDLLIAAELAHPFDGS